MTGERLTVEHLQLIARGEGLTSRGTQAKQAARTALSLYADLAARDEQIERLESERDEVQTALAEANVPRAAAVDELLYSQAHRVRLLRERTEQAEAENERLREALRAAITEMEGWENGAGWTNIRAIEAASEALGGAE